jgi:MYXO-CTERM domain-containing protein
VVQNAIGYAFAENHSNNPRSIAETIVHEAGHTFTLNHLYDCEDPMTYLNGCGDKYFQDAALSCAGVSQNGQWTAQQCSCGGATQNSHQTLLAAFGPREVAPPEVSITAPRNGATVNPGFPVRASASSDVNVVAARLFIDGTLVGEVGSPPWVFNAPDELDLGSHQVTVEVDDEFGNQGSESLSVVRGEPCACADSEVCVDGACMAGPDSAGGLGTSCTDNSDCDSNLCGQSGDESFCTAECSEDGLGCPEGFECLGSNAGGVCWWAEQPETNGGCGCQTGSRNGAPMALALLGLTLFGLRRRSRRP